MRATGTLVVLALVARALRAERYTFYRAVESRRGAGEGGRRVFGGVAAGAGAAAWRDACALLDSRTAPRCSCGVLAARWAVTAAHCIAPHVRYVRHSANAALPSPCTEVAMLYKHPEYMAQQETTAAGPDIVALRHDVGLVRAAADMRPPALAPAPRDLRALLLRHDLLELARAGELVRVFGFGRTEHSAPGETLYTARLQLVGCARRGWTHCACAAGRRGIAGGAGVCAGDSGGPVVFESAQVGVASMGPAECRAGELPGPSATSVLTSLRQYADIINATVTGADDELRMRGWPAASCTPPTPRTPRAALTTALLIVRYIL